MVSSELLETARQIGNGMTSPERTLVITSSGRTLTTAENACSSGDGRADRADLLEVVQQFSREHHVFDMGALAREAGTVVSAVMLGAIAGSGLLPFRARGVRSAWCARGGKGAEASLRGFARGFEIGGAGARAGRLVARCCAGRSDARRRRKPSPPPKSARAAFPAASARPCSALGYARLLEYQDRAYADLYVQRLQQVLAAERAADPAGAHGFATTREMARWLALWMAFDDIVRVADLKSRASRCARVQRRSQGAATTTCCSVYDHFKPGVPEFAALLPARLGTRD